MLFDPWESPKLSMTMSSETSDVSNMAQYHWLLQQTVNAQSIQIKAICIHTREPEKLTIYIFKNSVSAVYVIFYKALLVHYKEHASEVYE